MVISFWDLVEKNKQQSYTSICLKVDIVNVQKRTCFFVVLKRRIRGVATCMNNTPRFPRLPSLRFCWQVRSNVSPALHCTAWQIEGFWYTLRITMVSEFCGYHFTPNSIVIYYKKITSVIQISRTCFFWVRTSTGSAKCQLCWKINTSDHAEPAGPNQNEQTTSSQHVSFQTSTFHSTCIYICINYVSRWTMMNNDERSRQYN